MSCKVEVCSVVVLSAKNATYTSLPRIAGLLTVMVPLSAGVMLMFDEGQYEEDGRFANCEAGDLPADGVVTAIGQIDGQVP